MKSILITLGLLAGLTASAQTNIFSTNDTVLGGLEHAIQAIGSDMPTNLEIAVGPVYSVSAPVGDSHWGGFVDMVYNVTQNVGVGVGMEYLGGQWWGVNSQVQLKVTMHPLAFLGGAATNIAVTPFADGGAATSLSGGNNGALAAIAGGGGQIDVAHLLGGEVSLGGGLNHWTGTGSGYDGNHIFGFIGWRKGF